jgi:hypothetical protein
MRHKKVKFNRKPALDRAKTYKLKVPKKADYIEKIQAIIDNIGFTTAMDMKLNESPVHQYINGRHIMLIERFDRDRATIKTYVGAEMFLSDEIEVPYEEISLHNLELIANLLAEYAVNKEE